MQKILLYTCQTYIYIVDLIYIYIYIYDRIWLLDEKLARYVRRSMILRRPTTGIVIDLIIQTR